MPSYRGYRFPPDIISHAVWLYHRFALSFRDVEDVLARRGVDVTYEAIRKWCRRFGALLRKSKLAPSAPTRRFVTDRSRTTLVDQARSFD